MAETENERIIRLEEQVKMQTQIFTAAIERLEKKLDQREESYVTKDVLEIRLQNQDNKIASLQAALTDVRESSKEKRSLFPAWSSIIVALAALAVTIITLFVN